ncbi:MAG: Sec-independent protein translocase protein TatC [Candidatus Scalindua arabica]|uniref:Sec-independent protein translocase protein TatC n=1 Tax=Candidatus Scalindua arabica TaxID=1127984 RepID=A0A941W2N6_9BACT|nr:Sec-independent protein translocase protein TatC [Candidatus Scalindua arabica]
MEEKEISEKRLPISEHLEELRSRIINSIIVVVVLFFISWFYKLRILDIIKKPHSITMEGLGLSQSLQVLSYQEGFYSYIKLCLMTAVFLAYPVILYQIWKFVEAGLYKKERRYVRIFAPISFISFIIGVLFGYFFLIPFGLQFLIKVLGGGIQPIITMSQYISLVTMLTLALGVVFQLPLIMLFISRIGMLKAEDFIKWRMYAILIIFILAAVITPPDPFTQVMTALPMIILYEIGILIIRPTKKAVTQFSLLLGSGIILIYVVFLIFTLPTKADFMNSTGTVKILPDSITNWQPLSSESKIHNGTSLRTEEDSKASFLLKDGTYVIMDVNTEIKFVKNRKLDLLNGQILLSIKADDKPFMIAANNNIITSNAGNVDIRISRHLVFVTVTEGEAIVVANGEKKKVFEGRQLKLVTGGEPANIDKVLKWAKEMRKKLEEQNKLSLGL